MIHLFSRQTVNALKIGNEKQKRGESIVLEHSKRKLQAMDIILHSLLSIRNSKNLEHTHPQSSIQILLNNFEYFFLSLSLLIHDINIIGRPGA